MWHTPNGTSTGKTMNLTSYNTISFTLQFGDGVGSGEIEDGFVFVMTTLSINHLIG